MVHKKYIKRGNKVFGPYLYENYREKGVVKTKYLGKAEEKNLWVNKRVWFFSFSILFFLILSIWLLYNFYGITGKVSLQISPSYNMGELISGNLKLVLRQGEFLPHDTQVKLSLGEREKTFSLSELLLEEKTSGSYYVEGKKIEGQGLGYGLKGEKTIYPEISFSLLIFGEKVIEEARGGGVEEKKEEKPKEEKKPEEEKEKKEEKKPEEEKEKKEIEEKEKEEKAKEKKPKEQLQQTQKKEQEKLEPTYATHLIQEQQTQESKESYEATITGNAIKYEKEAREIEGKVNALKPFEYKLELEEKAEIKQGSVKLATTILPDSAITLTQEGSTLKITTNYKEIEKGFGKEYLTRETIGFDIKLENLDIKAEQEVLKISLVYQGKELVAGKANINLKKIEENLTLQLIKQIPDVIVKKNSNYSLNLNDYFLDAESYSAFVGENVSIILDKEIARIIPDENFTGITTGKITASRKEKSLESGFNIFVSEQNLSITTIQGKARIGQKVKWIKKIELEVPEKIILELPKEAENISVKEIEETTNETGATGISGALALGIETEREGILTRVYDSFLKIVGKVTGKVTEETEETIKVAIEGDATSYEIEYYTQEPYALEENTTFGKKIMIVGPEDIHYSDILAYTELPFEVSEEAARLYLLMETERQQVDIVKYDLNNNNLIDYIEWSVPYLSNQSYELEIVILNVYSHPSLYGNWSIEFNTIGVADLTITATANPNYTSEYTRWSNESENAGYDLKFLEVRCGDESLEYEWKGDNCDEQECSVFIANYSCNETAQEISKVLTPKRHVLKFSFGWQEVYAYNDVVSECGFLNSANTIYTLQNNVISNGTCFSVNATNVTLDCQGYEINYSSDGTLGYGVYSNQQNFTTIQNCIIEEGTDTTNNKDAIYFEEANNGTIDNNTITTYGTLSDGIYLFSSSNSNTITSNTIRTYGGIVRGIYMRSYSYFNNVRTNTIISNGEGVYIYSYSDYNTIDNNNITTSSADSYGFRIETSSNNSIINNNITTDGSSARGIYLYGSGTDFNIFSNNTIRTYSSLAHGIYFQYSYGTTFSDMNIETNNTNANALYIDYSNNFTIRDSILNSTNATTVYFTYYSSSENIANFTNVTGDDGSAFTTIFNTLQGNLDTFWYFNVVVTNSTEDYVNETNVSMWDANGNFIFSELTDEGGSIERQVLQEYRLNSTDITFFTPYIVNASKEENNYTNYTNSDVNFTISYVLDIVMGSPDTTAPEITAEHPTNTTYSIAIIDFNASINENATSCFLELDSSGENLTMTDFNTTYFNYTNESMVEGSHNYSITCNDTANNFGLSSLITFVIDITLPEITIEHPANQTYTTSIIDFNITGNEDLSYCNFTFNGGSFEMSSFNATYFNYTNESMLDGSWAVYFSCNDTAGNLNITETITFVVDTTNPLVTINAPSNITYSESNISINITLNETGYCEYSLNSGVFNYTMEANEDLTSFNATNTSIADGQYTLNAYCNDTAGNLNITETITFVIDTLAPEISIEYPTNMTYSSPHFSFNVTATETLDSCNFSLNDWVDYYNMTSFNATLFYYTNESIADGQYTAKFECNDTAGNLNITEQVTFFIDAIYPLIDFTEETEADGANVSRNWIYVNVSVTEINFENITFFLYNSTSLINSTIYTTQTYNINWTGLQDEAYYYNVTVYDTAGNENSTETRNINIDTQAPVFGTANYSSDDSSVNLTINVGDTPSGVSSVWASVFYVNDTPYDNYTLSIESGDAVSGTYNLTIIDIPQGDYNITYFANDTAGAETNTTSFFDIYQPITLTLNITDASGDNVNLSLEFYMPETTLSFAAKTTNTTDSIEIKNRTYDLEINFKNNTFTLKNITIASTENLFRIDDVPSPSGVSIALYKALRIIVLNISFVDSSDIVLDYSGRFDPDNFPAVSESGLTLHKCANWDFDSRNCDGTWQVVSGVVVNTTSDKISASVSNFSAYAVTEGRCGNSICEAAYGETTSTCSSDCVTPGGGGGGGGGGGSVGVSAVTKASFSISINKIEKKLEKGEIAKEVLSITNNEDKSISIKLISEGDTKNLINIPDEVKIEANSAKDVVIEFSGGKESGVSHGTIYVKNSINYTIPVTIITIAEAKRLLDMSIELLEKRIEKHSPLRFKITMYNMGTDERYDVNLHYSVVKAETNKTVFESEETIAIETSLSLIKSFTIEELEQGTYTLMVNAIYDNLSAFSSDNFDVVILWFYFIPEYIKENISLLSSLLFILTILVGGIFFIKFALRKKLELEEEEIKKKSIYIWPDFKLLPSERQAAWIGKVADSKRKVYLELEQMKTHTLIAGGTGCGKTISGMVVIEEALKKGLPVIVFDPTAQWTGFGKRCHDSFMLKKYKNFGMSKRETHGFKTEIICVRGKEIPDLKHYMRSGLTIFVLNRIGEKRRDEFLRSCLQEIFDMNLEETQKLRALFVFEEVHRLLPKYGGRHAYLKLEQAVREFRKWGIGLVMISQVLTDFKGAIRGNIATEIQMRTKYEGDVKRVREKYGRTFSNLVPRMPVSVGMFQNPAYNKGNPYFIEFRPIWHDTLRMTDNQIEQASRKMKVLELITKHKKEKTRKK